MVVGTPEQKISRKKTSEKLEQDAFNKLLVFAFALARVRFSLSGLDFWAGPADPARSTRPDPTTLKTRLVSIDFDTFFGVL